MSIRSLLTALVSTSVLAAQAQLPTVDITMVQTQTDLYEVRVRPDGAFDGLFSSLVFTLRWSASSSATLAEFEPTAEMVDIGIYPVMSGDVVVSEPYQYAPHVAFGTSSLASEGMAWVAGQEVVLGTIQVIGGPTDLELVNDDWTIDHNTNYFVSLNGSGRTGTIYDLPSLVQPMIGTGADPRWEVRNTGDRLLLRLDTSEPMVIDYTVHDAAGRSVGQGRVNAAAGRTERSIASSPVAMGMYTVHCTTSSSSLGARSIILP